MALDESGIVASRGLVKGHSSQDAFSNLKAAVSLNNLSLPEAAPTHATIALREVIGFRIARANSVVVKIAFPRACASALRL